MNPTKSANAVRWRAVLRRDRRSDGAFVFAVSSTRIYCRPSCPARRPRRDNVAFFATPEGAEAAGYRACRRCRPKHQEPRAAVIARVRRLIDADPTTTPRLARLADAVGLSPWHLQRTFREATGLTPRQYAAAQRLGVLKARLKESANVTEAIFDAGYGSSAPAYAEARKHLGMTPAAYRRGGRGLCLRYTVVATPLGRMLVAATDRGVSAVQFGRREEELLDGLRAEYPAAEIARDHGPRAEWVKAVASRVAGEPSRDVPLDIQATAFQWRVFAALRDIPQGETRTYGEIASAIGAPGAARAVGRACATNPVAVVVPCHRAVGRDGRLTGYRWGIDRKQRLLASEATR
jgi:AraC family transcriptional regulator of adaptative response/methylated-DNA-[protein]-cysteine methyltransferase